MFIGCCESQSDMHGFKCLCSTVQQPWIINQGRDIRGALREETYMTRFPTKNIELYISFRNSDGKFCKLLDFSTCNSQEFNLHLQRNNAGVYWHGEWLVDNIKGFPVVCLCNTLHSQTTPVSPNKLNTCLQNNGRQLKVFQSTSPGLPSYQGAACFQHPLFSCLVREHGHELNACTSMYIHKG